MKLRPVKILIPVLLCLTIITGLSTIYYLHKQEIEHFRALSTIDSVEVRLSATRNFIHDYPKSDSLFPAVKSALQLLGQSGDPDKFLQFALNQRILYTDSVIQHYLDSILFEELASDSISKYNYLSDREKYHRKYPDRLAFALTVLPHLNNGFRSDSIRNQTIKQFGNLILQSDNDLIMEFKSFSDRILQINDSLLIPLSNQFLVHALKNNTQTNIHNHFPDIAECDSVQNQNYYTLFITLAWNAYRQHRFSYALNLMSQATKYGDLDEQNGHIILGAAQAQCGELSEGWANVLKGLILNPEAEKQSVEIEHLYTTMFYRIRGSRENPERFLSQYRRSHR